MSCAVIMVCMLFVEATGKLPDWLITNGTYKAKLIEDGRSLTLTNGLIMREFRLKPDLFTWDFYSFEKRSSLLRAVGPEATIGLDGIVYDIGGVLTDTPRAYLNRSHLVKNMFVNPNAFHFNGYTKSAPTTPVKYTPRRFAPKDLVWPPKGIRLDLLFTAPSNAKPAHQNVSVRVHYELYDGVPFLAKWITISPSPDSAPRHSPPVEASIFSVEYLAVNQQWAPSGYNWLITDTDVAHASQVTWLSDPSAGSMPGSFQSNVNCSYTHTFSVPLEEPHVSFRVRHLVVGSADRERQGLARRRVLRLLAPWTQESPIFFHMCRHKGMTTYDVIDQMAEVGFEMMIYSCWCSGFDIESADEAYIQEVAKVVRYAKKKNIEVGGYDMIALSRVPTNRSYEATDPKTGAPIGSSCFASGWYDYLLDKFTSFMDKTGLSSVETDGPYGHYQCGHTDHAHHRNADDSVFQQTRYQARFFTELQERGVYINQPDNYFYQGGTATGLGYVEEQYSLPRWQDLSISRQGLFDDTFHYIPTIGWMQVPLVPYLGGGKKAKFEPLRWHIRAYEWALAQYLGAGVKGVYRGYRLYDSEETKAVVKKWVDFFKAHRSILTSDIIHVRRADMQSIDCFLHVNPRLETRGLAMMFNPTDVTVSTRLTLPLYYTGIEEVAHIAEQGRNVTVQYRLERDYSIEMDIKMQALGITWFTIR